MGFVVHENIVSKVSSNNHLVVHDTIVAAIEAGIITTAISGLTDIVITAVQDGDLLIYDAGTSKWVNSTLSHGDLTDLTVDDHTQYLLHNRTSDTQGDILYYNGSNWVSLAAGTDGQFLKTQGAAANPTWDNIPVEKSVCWVIESPETGGIPGPRIDNASTITRLDAYVAAATSVTFNIEIRSTIGSSGTDVLSSDMVADTDGESVTSSFNEDSISTGDWLWIDISATSGTPEYLTITLTFTEV